MRADARHNVEVIRQAALEVFRANGLTSPLEEVARVAGKAKGTIYHRFGSRAGLIDSVIDELVATQVDEIIRDVGALEAAPAERFEQYLLRVWSLQFDEPAANDVLLRVSPDSEVLIALCDRARTFALELLGGAQSSGRIRRDLTEDDLHGVIWERGVIARQTDSSRAEYLRRCEFVLRGLRAHEDER